MDAFYIRGHIKSIAFPLKIMLTVKSAALYLAHQNKRGDVMKIVNKKALEEARYMSELAVSRVISRVRPEAYWESAMLVLKEAYGYAS